MKQTLRSLVGGVVFLGMALAAEAAAASTAAGESGRSVRNSTSAAPVVGEAVTVFTEGEAGYAGFRIPVVIRTDDGALIAFAEARRHDWHGQCLCRCIVTIAGSFRRRKAEACRCDAYGPPPQAESSREACREGAEESEDR